MPLYIQKRGEIIPQDTRNKISIRYHAVTKAINREFRSLIDDKTYSLYVGSYGRGTAIKTSDLDILVELPATEYNKAQKTCKPYFFEGCAIVRHKTAAKAPQPCKFNIFFADYLVAQPSFINI